MNFTTRLVVAVLIALLATFLVGRWLGFGSSKESGPQMVFATSTIEAGSALDSKHLKLMPWMGGPAKPPGSFPNVEELMNRVARQKIYPGEPVLEGKLAPAGVSAGLAATIDPGKRAITVRVNDVIGVAGFALPGSFVDILVSVKQRADEQAFSKVVLDRVKVLAVAQETVTDNAKPKVVNAVTLELTPDEAEKLDLARTVGTLSLVLRNEMDTVQTESNGIYFNELTGNKKMATVHTKQSGKISVRPKVASAPPKTQPPKTINISDSTLLGVEVIRGLRKESE